MNFLDPRLPSRFWSKIVPEPNSGCWLWLASTNNGYGQFRIDGTTKLAHRIAFHAANGWWPEVAQHKCDTPACCNPAHLVGGTDATNNMDKQVKGRAARRLTAELVLAIRGSTDTDAQAAARFGVSDSMIGKIRTRECWNHLPGGGCRNPLKMSFVAAQLARYMRRRGARVIDIAHAFGTTRAYMGHVLARRRWATPINTETRQRR